MSFWTLPVCTFCTQPLQFHTSLYPWVFTKTFLCKSTQSLELSTTATQFSVKCCEKVIQKICQALVKLVTHTCRSTIGLRHAWYDVSVIVDTMAAGLSYLPNDPTEGVVPPTVNLPEEGRWRGPFAPPFEGENETHGGNKHFLSSRFVQSVGESAVDVMSC